MRITRKAQSGRFSPNQQLFGEVGASIVDEISQPLSAILSNLGAASNFVWAGPLELREILADVRTETLRACEIVREMREVFAGRITRKAFVQINSIVENLVKRLSAEARHCHTALMADLAADLPEVYADAAEIEQAIANVIWNGIEAMADTHARERALVIVTRLQENVVEISVSDKGAGISPPALPHLFETYFTTKPDRMGLGLAVARSIAELHQGTITAENNRGKGATFRLRLPLRHVHKTATPQHSSGVLKYARQG
jgi:C4-dicarboxylate-specific signal transduction histidine kinase